MSTLGGFAERRRAKRYSVLRNVALRSPRVGMVAGSITDLSTTGCQIATLGVFYLGTRVCVRMDGLEGWWGSVIWSTDTAIGVAFERPLHPAVVAHIARESRR